MRFSARTTRRVLLHRGLALVGAGAAMPAFVGRSGGAAPGGDTAGDPSQPGGQEDHVLVVVQLAGGNDGLNTVIPVRNDLYHRHRPRLGIDRKSALRIDDDRSFHPALTGFKSLYDEGLLAIAQGAGYANPSRSHDKSMDVWHTASPDRRIGSGWLGRYLDGLGGNDRSRRRDGLALTSETPLAMCGQRFRPIALETPGNLAGALRAVARMIASNAAGWVYYVSQRGYDTHVDQAPRHRQLLNRLGGGLEAFVDELRATRQLDRVMIVSFSEFGRRLAENASGGTDHGEANVMFVIGKQVRPGFHGEPPGLEKDDLHRGDPAWTTDFRRVYAAVLQHWLGTDARRILGEDCEPLPIINHT